jgi:cell division protein ZapA (FtsZ GTPase activity inhibitor)
LEQLVTIELFGQPYTFKADSEVQAAQEVADLLAKEVSKVEDQQTGHSSNLSNLTILILAALNIAQENLELKRIHNKFHRDVSERTAQLMRKLNDNPH